MRILFFILLTTLNTVLLADDLGKTTYEATCQNCHAPKFAIGMHAPAAFDKKAWATRFEQAAAEAKKNPIRFKTATDYLVYKANFGKGLMPHGGLCKEADVTNKSCTDEAIMKAIHYMAGN